MNINLADFYSRLGTIAIIILLGFFLGKIKWLNVKTNRQLINLLLMVFMPAALFNAFPATYSEASMNLFGAGLLGGIIVMLAVILVSRLIFNKWTYKGELRFESQFAFIFNNATFLGYPIIASTFGEAGLVPYCGFIIAFNVALFSYGVFLFEHKLSWRFIRDVLLNPNIIAVILGMLFFIFRITTPAPIKDAISFTAGAMTPLSLICIGFMLSHAEFKKLIKKWRLFLTALAQLTLAPIITWGILKALNFPDEVVVICTLIQALPTATSLGLFAEKYGGHDIEASELVAISTVLSIATLPIVVALFMN
jgi:predicted permease